MGPEERLLLVLLTKDAREFLASTEWSPREKTRDTFLEAYLLGLGSTLDYASDMTEEEKCQVLDLVDRLGRKAFAEARRQVRHFQRVLREQKGKAGKT